MTNSTDAAARRFYPTRQLATSVHPDPTARSVIASTSIDDIPMWALRTAQEINGLAILPRGWNGYGSEPPLTETTARAVKLLSIICRYASMTGLLLTPSSVSASGSRSVLLEWNRGSEGDLVIQVPEPGQPYGYCFERNGQEIERETPSEADLLPVIRDFFA